MASPPQPPSAASIPLETTLSGGTIFTRIRLTAKEDVPHILMVIHQMAVFEHLLHLFATTAASLIATLFPPNLPQPFTSTTMFLLELSPVPFPAPAVNDPHFTPFLNSVHLNPINDSSSKQFRSNAGDINGNEVIVVGFTLFYPSYPAFLAKPGFYNEEIFVREFYGGRGLGKLLLSEVVTKVGHGRVEWVVLD